LVAAGKSSSREGDLAKLVGVIVAGRYRVDRVIGVGGMGAVYAGEHLTTGRRVALKFVDREFAENELARARFAREIRAMSAIDSEHIPSVLDAGTHDDGRPFLVMDLLGGEDLGARLHREARIPLRDTIGIVAQILRGLGHAHKAGVVHRDLKPDNVFLVPRPSRMLVKILDFGVSKFQPLMRTTLPLALTARGIVLGTPFYIAPEQARSDDDVDARADLYSVGAILFECLAGRPPHVGERYEQVILSACTVDAPDLRTIDKTIPEPVAKIAARALARDRNHRYQTARDMLHALAEISTEAARIAGDGEPPSTSTPGMRISRPSRAAMIPWYATRIPVVATGLIAALVGGGVAYVVFSKTRAEPKPIEPAISAPIVASTKPAVSVLAPIEPVPITSTSATTTKTHVPPAASTLDLLRTFTP
jgi:serine/threonine-protein kinase